MKVAIFEDDRFDQLFPLTYFRPVFGLKCGHTLLWEKIVRAYKGASMALFCRDYLAPVVRQQYPQNLSVNDYAGAKKDGLLLINGRWLFGDEEAPAMSGPEEMGICGDTVAYMRLEKKTVEENLKNDYHAAVKALFGKLKKKEIKATLINFPWNLIHHNPHAIANDFKAIGAKGLHGKVHSSSVVYGPEDKVYVAEGAEIQPFVVLDTTGGPVIIDEGAIVYPYSRIEGPSCIGKKTLVAGAKVREGTAVGPVCRAGGEIEESIIHGYSNKWHDGFFGHGYACEWVNFGAMTTNSDLKNNYGNVKVYNKGKLIDTRDNKVGSFIGDHTKMGIGLLLNTGTILGVCSNIFTSGASMPSKFVPSFSWGSGDHLVEFKLEKVISGARTVMGRRKIEQTPEYAELMKKIYEISKWEKDVSAVND